MNDGGSDGEGLSRIIPVHADDIILPGLIAVAVALVLIEEECRVLSGEDVQLQRRIRHFLCVGQPLLHRQDASRANEHGDDIQIRLHAHIRSAFQCGPTPVHEIRHPGFRRFPPIRNTPDLILQQEPVRSLRKMAVPHMLLCKRHTAGTILHRLRDRVYQQALSEQEGRIAPGCLLITGEVKTERTDHHAVLLPHTSGQGVQIRHQAVAQCDRLFDGIVPGRALFSELPDLSGRVRAVGAHHRKKCGHLQPAHIKLPVARILHALLKIALPEPFRRRVFIASAAAPLPVVLHGEERTGVEGPPGISARGHIEALRQLRAQRLPGSCGVAGPEHCPIFLDGSIAGTREIEHPVIRIVLFLVLKHSLRVIQGKQVGPLRAEIFFVFPSDQLIAFPGLPFRLPAPVRAGEGFGAVAPPGVEAILIEPLLRLLPVQRAGLLVERIVGSQIMQQMSGFLHLRTVGGIVIHVRPHGHHGMHMHPVQRFPHRSPVGEALRIEPLFAPSVAAPGLPVLHDAVQAHAPCAVLPCGLDQFFLALIAFL